MGKKCTKCKNEKDLSEFYHTRADCKECMLKYRRERYASNPYDKEYAEKYKYARKGYRLKQRYGISVEEYESLLILQNGVCAICMGAENFFCKVDKTIRSLAVDHDHESKKIRGLLCNKCNRGIGLFQDNTSLLDAAKSYLEKHK
jgi:hypothetical protein